MSDNNKISWKCDIPIIGIHFTRYHSPKWTRYIAQFTNRDGVTDIYEIAISQILRNASFSVNGDIKFSMHTMQSMGNGTSCGDALLYAVRGYLRYTHRKAIATAVEKELIHLSAERARDMFAELESIPDTDLKQEETDNESNN